MARECDLVLVIRSPPTLQLQPPRGGGTRPPGADSYLIDNESQVQEEWLDGKRVVGISSGASAPRSSCSAGGLFRERGTEEVSKFEVVQEDVRFMLPKEIRKELAAGA